MRIRKKLFKKMRRLGLNYLETTKLDSNRYKKPVSFSRWKRKRNFSLFKERLIEKQKLCLLFMKTDKQMKNIMKIADSSEELVKILVSSLQSMVYFFGFAVSTAQARKLIIDSHISVKSKSQQEPKVITCPNYILKVNDEVILNNKMRNNVKIKEAFDKFSHQLDFVNLDKEKLIGKYLYYPKTFNELNIAIDLELVKEYF